MYRLVDTRLRRRENARWKRGRTTCFHLTGAFRALPAVTGAREKERERGDGTKTKKPGVGREAPRVCSPRLLDGS